MGNAAGRWRRERGTEGGSGRPGTAAGQQDDACWGGAEGLVHRAVHSFELHGNEHGRWLEAGTGRRCVPMGQQSGHLHCQAGVAGQDEIELFPRNSKDD
eukprot:13697686-Heterocapsa_arctica.AAC.1